MKKKEIKKKIFAILLMFFLIGTIVQGEKSNDVESDNNHTLKNSSLDANWLVMIYLNGDNLLYQVQEQQLEKIRNIGSTEQVYIAILHDSNENGDTKLYYLDGTTLIEQEWEAESNMADPNNLRNFVQKVRSDYSFQHDALFISTNRGSGWQGMLFDDTNGDNKQITLPEFSHVFSEISEGGNNKVDVLGIETCMGGMTENAYQFKDYIDYYIAFEDCSIAGYEPYSWPFEGPINDLIINPQMSPEEFSVNHLNYFEPKHFSMSRITTVLTVVNLAEIYDVKNALDTLALYFIDHIDEYRNDIQNAIAETRLLGELWYIEFYLDPINFLNLMSINDTEFESVKDEVIGAYNDAVVACDHLEDDPVCGLSLYIPRRKADYNHSFRFDDLLSSYEETEFAKDSNWNEFLISFLEIAENTAPNAPQIEGPNKGKIEKEYEFTISTDDNENDDLYFYVDWGDETSSGWVGPFASNEQVTLEHIWSENGSFTIKVKAKDSDESDWGTFHIKMPKNKMMQNIYTTWKFLFGKISDIETDPNNRFRFLPIKMLDVGYSDEDGFSMMVRDESQGPFPCCGYIDTNEFHGSIRSNFISGFWVI